MMEAKKGNKVLCHVCHLTGSNAIYGEAGLQMHLNAIHGRMPLKKAWEEATTYTLDVAVREARVTISTISDSFKENFGQYHLSSNDEVMQVCAKSERQAVILFSLLMDIKGVLQSPVGGEPTPVMVETMDAEFTFHVWKSPASRSYIVETVWAKSTQRNPTIGQAELGEECEMEEKKSQHDYVASDLDIYEQTLLRIFGHRQFRQGQRDIVDLVMSGQDGLVMMATGGGKSVCFILPAILSAGFSIVIIPTLSLLKDMYCRISPLCKTVLISGALSNVEKEAIYSHISSAEMNIKVILTTPEQVVNDHNFIKCIQKSKSLDRIIIDEAHCIDKWGNQFRPDYLSLKEVCKLLKVQIVCFTGTATDKTKNCILHVLELKEPFIYKMSFNRSNLHFSVMKKIDMKDGLNKLATLLLAEDTSSIVYCQSPSDCNKVCNFLLERDLTCVPYHGEICPIDKDKNQDLWLTDTIRIIVATKSLGMGIDKPNVKLVVHFSIPASIDDYFQEAGRSGRDGSQAKCILLYRFEDRAIHLNHMCKILGVQERTNALNDLHSVIRYGTLTSCRKSFILNHYGEDVDETCCIEHCDICVDKPNYISTDYSEDAVNVLLLLQGISSKSQEVSMSLLSAVFKGSKNKVVLNGRFDTLPLHGSGSKYTLKECTDFIIHLVCSGVLCELLCKSLKHGSTFLTFGTKAGSVLDRSQLVKRDIEAK